MHLLYHRANEGIVKVCVVFVGVFVALVDAHVAALLPPQQQHHLRRHHHNSAAVTGAAFPAVASCGCYRLVLGGRPVGHPTRFATERQGLTFSNSKHTST